MATGSDVFERIFGQPQLSAYLRSCVSAGRVSHATLLCGPAGSGKRAAARAYAAGILCAQGGCGECRSCQRVLRGVHPDVHVLEPAGAQGYLVEQMRELLGTCSRAPIEGPRQVFIVSKAESLGASCANALLKTLEEPPEKTLFILLSAAPENVLPTIVSRCQVVRLAAVAPHMAAQAVAARAGISPGEARAALAACEGSVDDAVDFAASPERQAFRNAVMSALASLQRASDWQLLRTASDLTAAAKAPLEEISARQKADLQENADFLSAPAVKSLEASYKRQASAAGTALMLQLCGLCASWLRDVLAVQAGAGEEVANADAQAAIEAAAAAVPEVCVLSALQAVARARRAISYNVTPETCIGALLLELKEVLYDTGSSH